ncbi:WxL domain-containing protein [Lacticaseibacillus saniviri]
MKKTLFLLPTLLIAPILLQANQHVLADERDKETTAGAVEFKEEQTPLELTEIPDFHFGINEINHSENQSYGLIKTGKGHDGVTLDSGTAVSIKDNRSASPANSWTLQAQISTQFKTKDTGHTLDGATITLNNDPTISNSAIESGFTGVVLGETEISTETQTLATGDSTAIGITTIKYGTGFAPDDAGRDEGIKLNVPKGSDLVTGDIYQADLTWTLLGAPDLPEDPEA